MSRRINTTDTPERIIATPEAEKLLEVLCVKYGFCLPSLWHARLTKNPPRSVERFTDTVFHAEGLDPIKVRSDLYRQVLAEVKRAFDRSSASERTP